MPLPLGPAYRIVTPRLVMRCWEPGDSPARTGLVERSLDFLRRWRPRTAEGEPRAPEDRLAQLRRLRAEFDLDRQWSYAVLTAEEGALVGSAALFRVGLAETDIGVTAWFGA